jgi:hypothetical protein
MVIVTCILSSFILPEGLRFFFVLCPRGLGGFEKTIRSGIIKARAAHLQGFMIKDKIEEQLNGELDSGAETLPCLDNTFTNFSRRLFE